MKNITILNDLNTLNKLHTSSVESYTTNNGIVDFTCENAGYVDNVVIEGKTLVNLSDLAFINEPIGDNITRTQFSNKNRCTNGEYTLINFADIPIFFTILNISTQMYTRGVFVDGRTSVVERLNEDESIYGVDFNLVDGWQQGDTSIFKPSLFMVLEGNHTDKPIGYFEGLKSVGQGDNIEVLTRNNNHHIGFEVNGGFHYWETGVVWKNSDYNSGYAFVKPNTKYCVRGYESNISFWTKDNKFIGGVGNLSDSQTVVTPSNCYIMKGAVNNSNINACYVIEGDTFSHIPYKVDKKQIPVTLRSLPNGVKDTIEKRGNKYVKVQRCGEVVLDGNVDVPNIYKPNHSNSLNYHRFLVSVKETPNFGTVCCDRLGSVVDYEIEKDNILADKTYSGFFVTLHNDKTSGTREGFKTWLQANPITVVYELATPQIIELPNFNPQTYKGNNTLLINSGVIQCDASFDVREGIRSELDVIKDKVSSLDDNIDSKSSAELVLLNGFKNALSSDVIKVFKNGNMCALQMSITNPSSVSSGTNIAKVPIGFVPKDYVRVCGNYGSSTVEASYNIDIQKDGLIIIYKPFNANSSIRINCVWEVE